MILLGGVLATIFIFFCPGVFAVAGRDIPLSSKIIGSTIYSLITAWFIFFFALFFQLNVFLLYILSIAVIGTLVLYLYSNLQSVKFKQIEIRTDVFVWSCIISFLFIGSVLLSGTMSSILNNFGSVFTGWDPVVSWNRWGMELFKNDYNPFKAAYPIFYPAMWSIIYKFQNTTEVWLITKATLSIVPLIFLLYCFLATLETKNVFFLILIFFIGHTFVGSDAMISGHMDAPVALMTVISCTLYWHAEKTNNKSTFDLIMLSWLAAGLASITKQPGLLVLLLCSLLVFQRYGTRIYSDKRILYFFMAVVSLPVTFLIIFSVFGNLSEVAGNLDRLESLSQKKSGGLLVVSAFNSFKEYLGLPIFVSMMLGGFLNFLWIKYDATFRIGLYSLVAGIIGFFLWALYFSYDIRNSLWVIGLLSISSATGYAKCFNKILDCCGNRFFQFEGNIKINFQYLNKIANNEIFRKFVSLLPLIFIPASLMVSDNTLRTIQTEKQINVGIPKVNQLVLRNKDKIDQSSAVVTHYMLYKYIPGAPGNYVWNRCEDVNNLKKSKNFHNGSYILAANWINKDVRALLDTLIVTNNAELIDSWKDWRLIKLINYREEKL